MAWGELKFDLCRRIPVGLRLCEYYLKNHINGKFPTPEKRSGELAGVTITAAPVMMKYDDAQEYTQKTVNGDYSYIPHYYVCLRSAWQLIEDADCWIMRNGKNGEKTIAIAVVVSDNVGIPEMYNSTAFLDAVRLTAYILHKNKLPASAITFSKDCPEYITSRAERFKIFVAGQYKKL